MTDSFKRAQFEYDNAEPDEFNCDIDEIGECDCSECRGEVEDEDEDCGPDVWDERDNDDDFYA